MNWTWSLRSRDGGMNGFEFGRFTTAGGWQRVLVHAAPAEAELEICGEDGSRLVYAELVRDGDYSPMTLLDCVDGTWRRREVWPDQDFYGVPVLLAGGEVGLLQHWEHAEDRSWWRWSVEFSNHVDRPSDWFPTTSRANG